MATDKFVTKEQLSEILNSVNNFKNVPETVVGKWVDGKPIYQTVIEKEISTYTDTQVRRDFVIENVPNASSIVDVFGYTKIITAAVPEVAGWIFPINSHYAGNESSGAYSYFGADTVNLVNNTITITARYKTSLYWLPTKIKAYIVLRYTKV